jgi:hypothetical protein
MKRTVNAGSRLKLLISCGPVVVVVACLLSACSLAPRSQYVAPRISGRILDAQSRQPVKDVRVRRVESDAPATSTGSAGGARLLEETDAVRSQGDGSFVLSSVRSLDVFQSFGWYSVTVAFERGGYQSCRRSYTLVNATNSPSGEPRIDTGDILMAPLRKAE